MNGYIIVIRHSERVGCASVSVGRMSTEGFGLRHLAAITCHLISVLGRLGFHWLDFLFRIVAKSSMLTINNLLSFYQIAYPSNNLVPTVKRKCFGRGIREIFFLGEVISALQK